MTHPSSRYSLFPASSPVFAEPQKSNHVHETVNYTPRSMGKSQHSGQAQSPTEKCQSCKNTYTTKPRALNAREVFDYYTDCKDKGKALPPLPDTEHVETGFRCREHSCFANKTGRNTIPLLDYTSHSGNKAVSVEKTTSPPSGLRKCGDSAMSPTSAHMSGKAKRLEAEVSAKTLGQRTARSLAPAMFGTLAPSTLAALATGSDNATTARSDSCHVRHKPVPSRERVVHELEPRPSSPTLVEAFRDFDHAPRAPPPTPVGSTPRDLQNACKGSKHAEPMSVWDSDDENGSQSDDEKQGLMERVKGLTLAKTRRGTGSSSGGGSMLEAGSRQHSKRMGKGKRWKHMMLCGCQG